MSKPDFYLLVAVCLAAICIAAAPGGAGAATCYGDPNCSLGTEPYNFGGPDELFGGGSSVGAVYWRQISDCYASPADLMAKGPSYYVDELLFDYQGRSPQNCLTTEINPDTTAWYISTGSGNGVLSLFGHDPINFWGPLNIADGSQSAPYVSFALSGIGLTASDVAAYDNGSNSYCQGATCVIINPPGGSCTNNYANPYPNPAQCYGPLIQFPVSIDPLAIAYANGGTYEKQSGAGQKEVDFHFNVQNGNGNGGLRLSVTSLCGIYNGQITNWNNASLTADNNNVSLEDPNDPTPPSSWNVPLEPVGRSDASGSTLTLTRHLAEVCSGYGRNVYKRAAATLQAAVARHVGMTQVLYSEGMAEYVAFTQSPAGQGNKCSAGTTLLTGYTDCIQQGRLGYIGTDYVLPYVSNNGTNSYGLFAAQVENHRGAFVSPTPNAALAAFRAAGLPPQTDRNGEYCPSCGTLMRDNPADWNPQALLGDPTERGAYPLVGTTNYLAYTCYADRGELSNLVAQVNYVEDAPINTARHGILEGSGLAVLPGTWRKAAIQTFITNSDGLGLQWSVAGNQGTTACQNAVGG